jgi:nitroimidazol reductase NimA-like FMN-containing flavoprotein (pyridoxamine 5'-phosphate oxidase superfamily)
MKRLSKTLKEFCEKQELMRLAFVDGKGYPKAVPVWFVIIKDEYYFGTDLSSAKTRALERDGRAGWVIDGGPRKHYKGASMSGDAQLVKDVKLRRRIHGLLGEKYFGSSEHKEFLKIYGEADNPDTSYFRLKPVHVVGWEY